MNTTVRDPMELAALYDLTPLCLHCGLPYENHSYDRGPYPGLWCDDRRSEYQPHPDRDMWV